MRLARDLAPYGVGGNLSLRCKDVPAAAAREAVAGLSRLDWELVATSAAHEMARGTVSKFQPCSPEDAEDRLLAERLLDLPSTLRFLSSVRGGGVGLVPRPNDVRLPEGKMAALVPSQLRVRLVREAAAATPKNDIEWVDIAAALHVTAEALLGEPVLGLDVETTLDFRALCSIQIATQKRKYRINPLAVGDLAPLATVLSAARPAKVNHISQFERRVLAGVGLELQGDIDTLHLSRWKHGLEAPGGHSLAEVCERELGIRVDKSAQTSDWARRSLGAEQLTYAALESEVLARASVVFCPRLGGRSPTML